MSGPAGTTSADDNFVLVMLSAVVVTVAGPSILAATGVKVSSWLIEHHVLVPADHAVFSLPVLDAGPDARRLVVVALALLALVAGAWALRQRSARAAR